MRQPHLRHELGYPGTASPNLHRARVQSFDDLEEECDSSAVQTVHALVSSLADPEQCSVYTYHLGAVWRFPSERLEACYEAARVLLELGLNRRGLP